MTSSHDHRLLLFTRGDCVPEQLIGRAFEAPEGSLSRSRCFGCALRRADNGGPMPDGRACDLVNRVHWCPGTWKKLP